MSADSYLTDGDTVRSWLLTTDHKRIALLYLFTITGFFFIGGSAAALPQLAMLLLFLSYLCCIGFFSCEIIAHEKCRT